MSKLSPKEIDEILGVQNEEQKGFYYCNVCKTDKYTSYVMKQKRSGDEGMSAEITCDKCKKKWNKN